MYLLAEIIDVFNSLTNKTHLLLFSYHSKVFPENAFFKGGACLKFEVILYIHIHYIYIYIRIYVYVYMYMYVRICIYIYIYIYIYTSY